MIALETVLAVVIGLVLIVCIVAIVLAVVSAMLQGDSNGASIVNTYIASQLPGGAADFTHTLISAGSAAGVIAVITGLIAAFGGAFLQATFVAYAGMTVAERRVAHLGQVLRLALRRTGPILVQTLVLGIAIIALVLIPVVMMFAGGSTPNFGAVMLFYLYLIALVIALVFLGIRWAFAPLAVVTAGLGPIQSLKYSWRLSKGRTWEILGAASLIAIAGSLSDIIFSVIGNAAKNSDGLALSLGIIELVVNIAMALFGVAVLMQVFKQSKDASEAGVHHTVNYSANVGIFAAAILVGIVSGSITNAMQPSLPNLENFNLPDNSLYQDDSTLPSTNDGSLDDLYNDDSSNSAPYNLQ